MKTILIVDDILENRNLLKVLLEKSGYKLLEADNGVNALKILDKHKVDIIISDVLMPEMDGYLFCQACKNDKRFQNIPFVFYTSTYIDKSDEDYALKLGASHFFKKTTDTDKILKLIKNLLKLDTHITEFKKEGKVAEKEVLKLYSKKLINKLENKNLNLTNEIFNRKKTEKKLINENEILDLISNNAPIKKVFKHIINNYQSHCVNCLMSISILEEDGIHLNIVSAPSLPKSYVKATKRIPIGKNVGSCGTAAFTKNPIIVSDISTSVLWKDYKDLALNHQLKSCWSIPILSEKNQVLGTFAIYRNDVKIPSQKTIKEIDSAVSLAKIAIIKFNILEEIKKRDESYRSLINQASDGIVTYTLDGQIHDYNKATHQTLGYTSKEFSKLTLQNIIKGEVVISQEIHKIILKGESAIFERQLICKDKTVIDVEVSAKLKKDNKILAIVRDITDRKKSELKLLESEYNLRQSQIAANIGSFKADIKTSTWEGSDVLDKVFGINNAYIKTIENWFKIIHPIDRELVQAYFEDCIVKHKKFDIEYRLIRQNDKAVIWVNGIGELLFDKKANPVKMIGTIQDITHRKQNELALKTAKEYTDKLVMSMQEGLLVVDLEGKIIRVNDSMCKILGYSNKALVGLDLPYPFAKTEDLDFLLKTKDEVAKCEAKSFNLEMIKKNGKKILTSFLTGNIKNDTGDVIALFATIKDISEETKAKQALENVALKSSQKKDVILELANLVGQDFNNSLNKITKLAAKTLNIERVSVWHFNESRKQLICKKLYLLKSDTFQSGIVVNYNDGLSYFEKIKKNKTIVVSNAQKRYETEQFSKNYLIPNNITSLMDVYINSANGFYGVISFEHVGMPHKKWTVEDQEFAISISNIVSLILESMERKIAEHKIVITNKQLVEANKELGLLRHQLEQENVYLRNELDLVFNYEEMVYGSAAFSNVLSEVEKVAPTNATVLLQGESGTGKELLARAVHNTGSRNKKPLIKVNCSAIPRELLESELFGHKKGSFTGATNNKIGKFELADGGTLFLDEIGELPMDMQPKILRFLQEGEIEVVGGADSKKLDVRVIAATNRNLIEEIEKKLFREDLYFRLNVFPIIVPALRDRKEDIPLLVEYFVDKFGKTYDKQVKYISEDTMAKLKDYHWPGNIRELENLIERALILSSNNTLTIPGFEPINNNTKQRINNIDLTLKAVLRNHILQVLKKCNWKISGAKSASEVLGLKPSTLRDKMSKLGIVKPDKI